jgi:hypothetical protein
VGAGDTSVAPWRDQENGTQIECRFFVSFFLVPSTLKGAETGIKTHCRSAQPMSLMGQSRHFERGVTLAASPQ